MIECAICEEVVDEFHEYDKKACVECANKYFHTLKPDLTRWLEGLSASEKSVIIRGVMRDHFQKEQEYKKKQQEANAPCCPSYW